MLQSSARLIESSCLGSSENLKLSAGVSNSLSFKLVHPRGPISLHLKNRLN